MRFSTLFISLVLATAMLASPAFASFGQAGNPCPLYSQSSAGPLDFDSAVYKDSPDTILLDNCDLKDSDVTKLVVWLNAHPDIDHVSIENNNLHADAAKQLSSVAQLQVLFMGNNYIGNEGAAAFSSNQTLILLDLDNNQIDDNGARELAKNTHLLELDINNNRITDQAMPALIEMPSLIDLRVEANALTDASAVTLAGSKLRNLFISNNYITDKGAVVLSKSKTISGLHIQYNRIGKSGIQALLGNPNFNVPIDQNPYAGLFVEGNPGADVNKK